MVIKQTLLLKYDQTHNISLLVNYFRQASAPQNGFIFSNRLKFIVCWKTCLHPVLIYTNSSSRHAQSGRAIGKIPHQLLVFSGAYV